MGDPAVSWCWQGARSTGESGSCDEPQAVRWSYRAPDARSTPLRPPVATLLAGSSQVGSSHASSVLRHVAAMEADGRGSTETHGDRTEDRERRAVDGAQGRVPDVGGR